MVKKNIRRWIITAATIAGLSAGGYKVVKWDDSRGYGIIDKTHTKEVEQSDTLWFSDSSELAKFVEFGKSHFNKGGVLK